MEQLIQSLIGSKLSKNLIEEKIQQSNHFDKSIFALQPLAASIWEEVDERFNKKEEEFRIPFTLIESQKLYALDALIICQPFIKQTETLRSIGFIFSVYYLIVHYFDDHVEHPDKFYSKFKFSYNQSTEQQKGAAPFSFVLISLSLIEQELQRLPINREQSQQIHSEILSSLAIQTRYFTTERNENLSSDDVLDMKQRQVSGRSLLILASLISMASALEPEKVQKLRRGLVYLGSLIQITDDIRDLETDTALRNANIVTASIRDSGEEKGIEILSKIFTSEVQLLQRFFKELYTEDELRLILSLPFYPFFIDKAPRKD
jgi:hypothetical protein